MDEQNRFLAAAMIMAGYCANHNDYKGSTLTFLVAEALKSLEELMKEGTKDVTEQKR